MKKFSDKSVKDLQNAVRRYNMMRSVYLKNNEGVYVPPPASTQNIMNNSSNTKQLREAIKSLNDVRKVTDFEVSKNITNIKLTKGEERTFKRLTKRIEKKYDKEIENMSNRLQTSSPAEQMQIIRDIQELRTRIPSLSGFKTKRGYRSVVLRMEHELTRELIYGENSILTKDHFLSALEKVGSGLETEDYYINIMQIVSDMSDKEFQEFALANPSIVNLDYIYNATGSENISSMFETINFALEKSGYIA